LSGLGDCFVIGDKIIIVYFLLDDLKKYNHTLGCGEEF